MEKRLQSIKIPRDLTLGGTKQKKIFTPNLNVTRNKEKRELFIKNEERKKQSNKRNLKNKQIDKPERFVQSSGIFSEGVGIDAVRKARYEKAYSARDDPATYMPIPKVKKDEWQIDNKNESKVYDDIMGCDDLSDIEEKLPFIPLQWSEADLKESRVPFSVKPDIKVKCDESTNLNKNKLNIEANNIPREFQEADSFSDSNPAVMLWTMPDSFAGKGLSDDPTIKTLFDYKLSDMLEGEIGKIQIRKSGKIELVVGCVKYDLEQSNLQTFSEKIVKIDVAEENNSQAAVLGDIQSRFILNPDWQYLLREL